MNRLTLILLLDSISTNDSLHNFYDNLLNDTLKSKKQLLVTRQAKHLRNLLIRARFDLIQKPVVLSDFKNVKTKCAFYSVP